MSAVAVMALPATKHCGKCDQTKPRDGEHFHRNTRSRDGLQGWCKPCMNRLHSGPRVKTAPTPTSFAPTATDDAEEKRAQALYDRGWYIVSRVRESWIAIEEITQSWGCPDAPIA